MATVRNTFVGTAETAVGIFGQVGEQLDRRLATINAEHLEVFELLGRAEGQGVTSQEGGDQVFEGRALFLEAASIRDQVIDAVDLSKTQRIQLADRSLSLYAQAKIRLKQSLNEASPAEIAEVNNPPVPMGLGDRISPKMLAFIGGGLLLGAIVARRSR